MHNYSADKHANMHVCTLKQAQTNSDDENLVKSGD